MTSILYWTLKMLIKSLSIFSWNKEGFHCLLNFYVAFMWIRLDFIKSNSHERATLIYLYSLDLQNFYKNSNSNLIISNLRKYCTSWIHASFETFWLQINRVCKLTFFLSFKWMFKNKNWVDLQAISHFD